MKEEKEEKQEKQEKQAKIFTLEDFDCEMGGEKELATEIMPAFETNNVAIALVSSEEYAPFAAVVIASIIANTSRNNNYDIVLLTNDMYQRDIWRIKAMAINHPNVSIRVLDISKMIKGFSFYTWAHFTSNTYYRLLTPDVFVNYEKVIYLDSDIVVNHDIAELFNTDVTGYYIACAYDTHVVSYCTRIPPLEQRSYNIKKLGLEHPEEYFQAGVSVFNVTKLHKDFEPGYLLKQGMTHKFRWLDQDLINFLFQGQIKVLENKWNVMVSNIPDNLDEYHLPENLKQEYYESRRNPYIIHYVGRTMPCYTTTPDLYEYFWIYARQTVFYEILLQRASMDYSEKLKQSMFYQSLGGRVVLILPRLKGTLKQFVSLFFPKGTRRREWLKRIYAKIRV